MKRDLIYSLIPHREPFLFVDELVSIEEHSATATLYIDPEAAFFKGHYPNNPLMPGVLLCESVFQTAALFLAKRGQAPDLTNAHKTPILSRIKEAKFKHPVRPGETVTLTVTLTETLQSFYFLKGSVHSQGKLILTLEFALALVDSLP